MRSRYLPFADWMKAAGMAFIVWGHVAATATYGLTPPFNLKQLGVAFFVFLTGFTLAREQRPRFRVVFNRYFEVFAFGLAFAVVMSLVGLTFWDDTNPSNFLPLAGGLHLIANAFPANPTTWYIGTYLHLLLLWALVLRGRTIGGTTLAIAIPVEIGVRAGAMLLFGSYVAYMLLSNWIGVLLLGLMVGRGSTEDQGASDGPRRGWSSAGAAVAFVLAWPLALNTLGWRMSFPFMTVAGLTAPLNALVVSTCVSTAYLAYTLSGYALLGQLPANAVVRFFARNTVVVFIAHMPLYYLLEHLFRDPIPNYTMRVGLEFVLCYGGLAAASEVLRHIIRPHILRDRAIALFHLSPDERVSTN